MTTDDTQALPIRLPKDLYERLRKTAFDTRESMNSIVTRAVDRALSDTPRDTGDTGKEDQR